MRTETRLVTVSLVPVWVVNRWNEVVSLSSRVLICSATFSRARVSASAALADDSPTPVMKRASGYEGCPAWTAVKYAGSGPRAPPHAAIRQPSATALSFMLRSSPSG